MEQSNKRTIEQRMGFTELQYIEYVIQTMKSHDLTFAFFELSEIRGGSELIQVLESKGYEVKIENAVFKVFWETKTK